MSGDYYVDYEREPLQTYHEEVWEVLDPWSAQIRGAFYCEADAALFCKAVYRQWRKNQKKAKK